MSAARGDVILERLHASHTAVWRVAVWLNEVKGCTILIPPTTYAKNSSDWRNHIDRGDIYATRGKVTSEQGLRRIEVKHLQVNFTSRDDWPFRDKFIVNEKGSHDRSEPKPHAYVIVSNNLKAVAVVKGSTEPTWYLGSTFDKPLQMQDREFYYAPLDAVEFTLLG